MDRTKQSTLNERQVTIEVPSAALEGNLSLPPDYKGVVLFAHGSGSSRHSPRNRYVAEVLQGTGVGTLLFDLLTAEEELIDERTARLRFDINMLAKRLVEVTDWLVKYLKSEKLSLGYFGASTGAAAALIATALRPEKIQAVVSRGGRPDLAGDVLPRVKAPTLLIVGGEDFPVIDMNREALAKLSSEKSLVIIPGATHLFEERGALEEVSRLAAGWFLNHLGKSSKESKSK